MRLKANWTLSALTQWQTNSQIDFNRTNAMPTLNRTDEQESLRYFDVNHCCRCNLLLLNVRCHLQFKIKWHVKRLQRRLGHDRHSQWLTRPTWMCHRSIMSYSSFDSHKCHSEHSRHIHLRKLLSVASSQGRMARIHFFHNYFDSSMVCALSKTK